LSADPARPPVIVTDSSCDIPPSALEMYPIHYVPLKIIFGSETYMSGVTMTFEQFSERLNKKDVYPKTAQPSLEDFVEKYTALTADGSPVLSIHHSADLGGTFYTAQKAAQALPDRSITVWNSRTISCALGLQVLTAARAALAGYTVDQILPLLQQNYEESNFLFCLDDISPLVRGGRIGKVKYYVAQALSIKPIITVSKSGDTAGTYVPSADHVRSLLKAADVFLQDISHAAPQKGPVRAIIAYGADTTYHLAQRMVERLRERQQAVYVVAVRSSPALCVHVGTRALAVGFAPGKWPV
jgi:DegV family protein with EDD domain